MDDIIIRLQPNQVLYKKDDPSQALYIIKRGKVAMVETPDLEHSPHLAQLETGQIIGDLAFFDSHPRSSSAVAITECEIMGIPYALVRRDFELLKPWFKSMLTTLALQVRRLVQENRSLRMILESSTTSSIGEMLRYLSALDYAFRQYGVREGVLLKISLNDLHRTVVHVFSLSTLRLRSIMEALSETPYFSWDQKQNLFLTLNDQMLKGLTRFMTDHIEYGNDSLLRPTISDLHHLQCLNEWINHLEDTQRGIHISYEGGQKLNIDLLSKKGVDGIEQSDEDHSYQLDRERLTHLEWYFEMLIHLNTLFCQHSHSSGNDSHDNIPHGS